MKKVLEMREKRAKAWDAAKAFLDTRAKDGVLSAEDNATYDKMLADVDAMAHQIAIEEDRVARDAAMAQPTSSPLTAKPNAQNGQPVSPRATAEYREDFLNLVRGKRPIHNVMEEGTSSTGGYLVPVEFDSTLVKKLAKENVIRSLAKIITTTAPHRINIALTDVSADWVAESGVFTPSTPTFNQLSLDAYTLRAAALVSEELLQDSMFDLEDYLISNFALAFAAKEEQAFCVGTGEGQPTGIFTVKGGDVGVTTAGTADIKADELIDLTYSLKDGYKKNAVFILNSATLAGIRKLKDGNGVYMWQPSLQADQPDRLLGFPVHISQYAPTIAANAYTVAFGDFQNYWIADRSGRTIRRANELHIANLQTGFYAFQRVDGKTVLPEGIKLLKQHA
ncbi:MAG: phage major capsid protein [Clostridiaceae bacterium]|nr:phage major capsid protein [Clostridiaceae bacterium]